MRRALTVVSIIVLMSTLAATGVLALASGLPSHDSFVRSTSADTNFNGQGLSTYGSTSACTLTDWSYMQWDLSTVPAGETIQTAVLTLKTTASNNVLGATTLTLYQTTDSWTETGLTGSNAPSLGTAIQTVAAPTSIGQVVTFDATALATYLNSEAHGDKVASVSFVQSEGEPLKTPQNRNFSGRARGAGKPTRA